jgi:hypothetical protein
MTAGTAAHATVIAVDEPTEVAVGADFLLTVLLSCPSDCDLSGIPVEVMSPDGVATTVESAAGDADMAAVRKIALKAPLQVDEHIWCLSCAAHESGGWRHDATLVRVRVRTRPHETSLAVWAIPSPVATGQPFTIKVGAKSAAECDLAGTRITVCDEAGAVLASDILGDTPWPGTTALYWSELKLVAPAEAGMFSWSVKFAAAELALPHRGASSRFSIAIVRPPEHKLTVKVIEQKTATPIENAQVRLGAYRAATGGSGLAELMLPKGSYDLNVWKSGYEAPTTPIAIDADLTVQVVIAAVPDENPDAGWLM